MVLGFPGPSWYCGVYGIGFRMIRHCMGNSKQFFGRKSGGTEDVHSSR